MSEDTIEASELAQFEQPRRRRRGRTSADLILDDAPTHVPDDVPAVIGDDGLTAEQRRISKEMDKVQSILAANKNTGAKVLLSRKNKHTGRFAVLATIPVDEYDEDQLAMEYGAGIYQSRIRLPNHKLADSWTWDVDPSVKPSTDNPASATNGNHLDLPRIIESVRDRNNGDIREVIETISDRNQQTFQMMMKQMQDSNAQMMTLIAQMTRPHHGGSSDASMMTLVTTMLTAIMNQKTSSIDQMVDAMAKLKQLAGEESKGGGNDVMDTILGMMAPLAGQLMGKLAPQQLPAPQSPAPLPEQARANPAAPVSGVPSQMAQLAGTILKLAEKDSDPVSAANIITDLLDDTQSGKLLEFLEKDNWWSMLMTFEDRVIPYQPWFENVRKEILDILGDSEEVEEENQESK